MRQRWFVVPPLVVIVVAAWFSLGPAFGPGSVCAAEGPPPRPTNEAAVLPDRYLDICTIEWMEVGDVRWTQPWAMMADAEHRCWLNANYSAEWSPWDTATMRVERTADGYVVSIPDGEFYQPSDSIPWFGATEDDLIPVLAIE